MKLVVTGNIGCGKSTVVRMLQQALPQYQLFDFDAAVAMLYTLPSNRLKLIEAVGTSVKSEVSDIVHNDLEAMQKVKDIFEEQIHANVYAAFRRSDIILDIPLYFEYIRSKYQTFADFVLCVAADERLQVERVRQRNGWSDEKIKKVIANQLEQGEKCVLSDHVIWNTGTLEELKQEVDDFILTFNKIKS